MVVFALDGGAGEAAEHGELADVGQSVGDRALKKLLGSFVEFGFADEKVVEALERFKKTSAFGGPRERRGIAPDLFTLRDGECPVEEVADVGENFAGGAAFLPDAERSERVWSAAQGFSAAVGDGGIRGRRRPRG